MAIAAPATMDLQVAEIASASGRKTPHSQKIARICRQLRDHVPNRPLSLLKRSPSHEVPRSGDLRRYDEHLDLSELDEVLHIDPLRRICVAEPGVTFARLVEATMPYGLAPRVVPELKDITIGGAVS